MLRTLRELTHSARRCGHSLVELLAVVLILAVIAAVVVARFANYTSDGHATACYVTQGEIEVQAQLWYRNQGTWPAANLSGFGSNTAYFPDGTLPVCPSGGTFSFNSLNGEVTCTHHP
jgi:prepilin-type N-terminal cleavage/methylation domain-containing protein